VAGFLEKLRQLAQVAEITRHRVFRGIFFRHQVLSEFFYVVLQ
jgi:hypothetical protein